MGLGNLLYVGLWAYQGEAAGERRRVLLHPQREAGIALFPRLRDEYFVTEDEAPFLARRVLPWREEQTAPTPYRPPALDRYIRHVLLPGSPVAEPMADLEGALVVNVRRGDYYTVPQHRAEFGMGPAHLHRGGGGMRRAGRPSAPPRRRDLRRPRLVPRTP